jgi:Fe-S cluster assembly protein SufB
MVPEDIKKTFDRIGIPEAEKKFLSGASAQYDSEVVYHNLKKEWEEQGVVFLDMDTGLREHPEIVKQYFGSVIPMTDNKFAALNTAVWSGGSFVYVPKGVHVKIPLQAYFRINTKNAGQFERTLIIAEEGAKVSYIEGCSAPIYSSGSLHSAVVELISKKNSYIRYTTIQNWSNNVYNLVTKRAVAHEDAVVEWVDGNIGSKVTMKYPCIILKGKGARGEVLSVAFAGAGQTQDAGAKIIHAAPNTTSRIISKSISQGGGRSAYRGMLKVNKGAKNCKAFVQCDAYLLDEMSRSDTYPTIQIDEDTTTIGHEAKVGKIGTDKLFYLMSRGLSEKDALAMVVLGFIDSFTRELPMEYAVELNRLIEIQLEGAVG